MPFGTQNRVAQAIGEAATAIYRISIIKRVTDTGLAFVQAFGHGDPDDAQNQELLQEIDIDHVQHYGLVTHPPASDTVDVEGIVVDADGGEACIAERFNLEDLDTHGSADQMPARNLGDTVLYAKDGTYIFMDADGKLTIKAMTDNIEIITEAGKQIKLGQDGVTYRDAAYAHNTEAGASKVASGATLNTWTHEVKDDIAATKADLDSVLDPNPGVGFLRDYSALINNLLIWARAGGGVGLGTGPLPAGLTATAPTGETLIPKTTDGINTDVDHSYVSSGSTKVEVEP